MTLQINKKVFFAFIGAFTVALVSLTVILWLHRPVHLGKIDVSPFENDMVEALVRGLIYEDGLRNEPVIFLAFGESGTSPSPDFIRRFADCRQPAVACLSGSVAPPTNRILEKNTGHPGLVVKIIDFHQAFVDNYDVTVSISSLPRGHDHVIFRVYNVGGSWYIKKRS